MKDKNLAEWRAKNMKEMESNLAVAVSVRDNPEAASRDRLEAVKLIGRMLHALQPERGESKRMAPAGKPNLTKEHKERLDSLLDRL